MGETSAPQQLLTAVRSHPDCGLHLTPPGHPESVLRWQRVVDALREPPSGAWAFEETAKVAPEEEVLGALQWIHDREHVQRLREAAARGGGYLDSEDCSVSKGSFSGALAAAGLSLAAALDLVNGRLQKGFLALRPPGHHAERHRARGYCFLNNVALAAEVIAGAWQAPVLIVDFDAHHGNGTQQIFYDRADVGFVSVHAYPGFPGTGTADEEGDGAGLGTTRNVPVARGSDDEVVCGAFERAVGELASRLRPVAILVSAGFSAHHLDPVGGLRLTGEGFASLTRTLVGAADTWADGRILSFLEGGFHPEAVAESARIHVREMAGLAAAN